MTVYVDAASWTRATSKNPRKTYCHCVATTLEELHEFVASIGVKRHFFHRSALPHYDLTSEQRDAALEAGAVFTNSRTFIAFARAMTNQGEQA